MFCSQCGREIDADGLFCSACGKKVADMQDSSFSQIGRAVTFVRPTRSHRRSRIMVFVLVLIIGFGLTIAFAILDHNHTLISKSRNSAKPRHGTSVRYITPDEASNFIDETVTVRMTVESIIDDAQAGGGGNQYLFPVLNPGQEPALTYSGFEVERFIDALDYSSSPPLRSYLGKLVDVTGEVMYNGPGGSEILISPLGGRIQILS